MRGILWGAGAVLVFTASVAGPACSSDGSFEDYTRPSYTDGTCGVDDEECHPPQPECTTAADCPWPPDLRCGEAICKDGKCGLNIFFPGDAIAWQSSGDCKTAYCDSHGNVVLQEEPSDRPKTSDPCIVDLCQGSTPVNNPVGEGEPCIDAMGVCAPIETTSGPMLRCAECIWPNSSTCPSGQVCAGKGLNFCVPGHCTNHIQDEDETASDCGGLSCAPCFIGLSCLKGSDCAEVACKNSVCVPPSHDDGIKNDGETGKDCGCNKCARCPDGEGCMKPEHCTSGVCYLGLCQAPTCFDMVQNGTEQGVDCGEGCQLACPVQSPPG